MEAITDQQIRGSFVNCSRGEASRINLPRDLDQIPWAFLDFLGWRDPGAPERAYLVTQRPQGLVGITLRGPTGARRSLLKTTVCSICISSHPGSGVNLLVPGGSARPAGTATRSACTCARIWPARSNPREEADRSRRAVRVAGR